MATFFIQLGMMSAQASVAILVVLVLRKVFALLGVSKKYTMLLWMIPFWLLICPVVLWVSGTQHQAIIMKRMQNR